jgi:hypothetical protein
MKLAFIIPVYKDFNYAKLSYPLIRKHYPDSDVAIMSDGNDDPAIEAFCMENNIKYFFFKHSHNNDTPGGFTRNLFYVSTFLDYDLLIKTDPDSRVTGSIEVFDQLKDCIFGTLMKSTIGRDIFYDRGKLNLIRPDFIQNGVFGIGSNIVKRIIESKYFEEDSHLRQRMHHYLSYGQGQANKYALSSELLMAIACNDLNIPLYNHKDFYSIIYIKSLRLYYNDMPIDSSEVKKKMKKAKFIHPIYE